MTGMGKCAISESITAGQISAVYADPYISGRVWHDHRPAGPIDHPLAQYLAATVDDEFVGAFLAIKKTAIEIEWHSLLHKRALPWSRDLGKLFLRWAFDQGAERVSAPIIEGIESAMNYGLRLGMTHEGTMRCACLQGGILKSVYLLAMTRQDRGNL